MYFRLLLFLSICVTSIYSMEDGKQESNSFEKKFQEMQSRVIMNANKGDKSNDQRATIMHAFCGLERLLFSDEGGQLPNEKTAEIYMRFYPYVSNLSSVLGCDIRVNPFDKGSSKKFQQLRAAFLSVLQSFGRDTTYRGVDRSAFDTNVRNGSCANVNNSDMPSSFILDYSGLITFATDESQKQLKKLEEQLKEKNKLNEEKDNEIQTISAQITLAEKEKNLEKKLSSYWRHPVFVGAVSIVGYKLVEKLYAYFSK